MGSSRLLPGRLLRQPGPPKDVNPFQGVQIDDPQLANVLSPDAQRICLYEGTLHGEGPVWYPHRERLFWSDVPNRRLLFGGAGMERLFIAATDRLLAIDLRRPA